MAKINGIDVSHHQGTINWKQTASELRRVNGGTSPGFAILRVGYSARHGKGGLWMDSQWTQNVEGCEAYGVPMGVYVYSYDTSPEAAAITARQVVNQLRGHIWDYPIYLDVEYEPYNTGKDGSGRSPDAGQGGQHCDHQGGAGCFRESRLLCGGLLQPGLLPQLYEPGQPCRL